MIKIYRCKSNNEDFGKLIALLDSDLNARYGKLQKQYNAYNQIDFIDTTVIAYSNRIPVGCGCFRKYDDHTVEIKRMFVKVEYRGKGVACAILSELEKWAQENGFRQLVLETGIKQLEAIGLYQKYGYEIIENFGQYTGNKNSICMRKELT